MEESNEQGYQAGSSWVNLKYVLEGDRKRMVLPTKGQTISVQSIATIYPRRSPL